MRDVLVAAVIAAAGKVNSRVKLQKMIYLLESFGFDLGFYDSSLRDFGPFSSDLASTIDALSTPTGMLTESEARDPGAQGQAIVRYSYEARPELGPFLDGCLEANFGERAAKLRELAKGLSRTRTRVLEVAATAAYLRREASIEDEDQLWAEVRRRKGHLEEHFAEAKSLLDEWDKQGLLRPR
jgi:uncharacterized protein YwgA